MRKLSIILTLLILHLKISYAQDIHFSQFLSSPLNLNPANCGFFEENYRFAFNNKTQWSSITTPYNTFAASAETHLMARECKQDFFNIGINVNRDIAGDSKLGTTQFNINTAYIKAFGNSNNNFISIGLQCGVAQRSMSYEKLQFDNQFDGTEYNSAFSNNEGRNDCSIFYPDLSSGLHWRYIASNKRSFNTGISVWHINQPKNSLVDNDYSRLSSKIQLYHSVTLGFKGDIWASPTILIEKQGKYKEIVIGSLFKIIKKKKKVDYFAMNIGIFARTGDAIILLTGIDYNKTHIAFSYDINTSRLNPASRFRGGSEIAIIQKLSNNKSSRIKSIPCPIF